MAEKGKANKAEEERMEIEKPKDQMKLNLREYASSYGSASPSPLSRCLSALTLSDGDTEKLSAMFLVPKLLAGTKVKKADRAKIMKAIGFSFLARMLR
jgi:hypothetical protein